MGSFLFPAKLNNTFRNRIIYLVAFLGVHLENGKYPTLRLFFVQTAIY